MGGRQFTEHDLRLLDYESVELKYDEPEELSVYDAVAKAGADRVTHRFIYLKSRCTQKGGALLQTRRRREVVGQNPGGGSRICAGQMIL